MTPVTREQESEPMALWITESGMAKLNPASIGDGVLVKTLFSGISRGTEKLVFEGLVPKSESSSMRCHGQQGEFSFPIKYGYCSVGNVLEGPLAGQIAFCLHPHQNMFRAEQDMLHPLPKGLPPERAVLAANMETALNITWDSKVSPDEKVAVIGAGVIGSLAAYLLSKTSTNVTLIDINPSRRALADQLGITFAETSENLGEFDLVVHASATESGLNQAIELCGYEGRIIEASWFGEQKVSLSLGGAFHSKRLNIKSSQVGGIAPWMKTDWNYQKRMDRALELLIDPVLDCLISGESEFENAAVDYAQVLNDPETLCHRLRY